MEPFPYTKLVVIGTTGSGKSTLAEKLAEALQLDYVELDALYWQPRWVGTPDDEFIGKVQAAISSERWVVAGNYSRCRPIIWPRAEVVFWLDYPFWTVFWQLLRRTIRRAWTREVLWGTNVERFLPHLKLWSNESLFNWLFQTYWRRKREYPKLFALPEFAHLKIFQFKSPIDSQKWFVELYSMNHQSKARIIKE